MATIDKAAAFIHANMPLGQEGSLSVQQAWDVATFIDGKVHPQDPRFDGSPEATRSDTIIHPFPDTATSSMATCSATAQRRRLLDVLTRPLTKVS